MLETALLSEKLSTLASHWHYMGRNYSFLWRTLWAHSVVNIALQMIGHTGMILATLPSQKGRFSTTSNVVGALKNHSSDILCPQKPRIWHTWDPPETHLRHTWLPYRRVSCWSVNAHPTTPCPKAIKPNAMHHWDGKRPWPSWVAELWMLWSWLRMVDVWWTDGWWLTDGSWMVNCLLMVDCS